jgi:hypothetical protein
MNRVTLDFPVPESKPTTKHHDFGRDDSPHWFVTHTPHGKWETQRL